MPHYFKKITDSEGMEWYLSAAIVVTLAVMLSASFFDWRFREVPDIHWWILGVAGLALTAASLWPLRTEWTLMLIGASMILIFILLDVDVPRIVSAVFCIAMTVLFIYPAATSFDDPVVRRLLVIPACFIIFYLLFMFGILRGGADAKCLMVLAMAFQTYPLMGDLPLIPVPAYNIQLVFSFPIAVLFHAALFSFAWLFWTVIRKIYRKDDPVDMYTLSWYRMSIEEARRSHVWPKQDAVGGMIVNVKGIPDDGALDRLEAAGAKDVWVTPIIPFMVPITAAIIFILSVGSLLNILLSL